MATKILSPTERWNAFQRSVNRDAPNYGLSDRQVSVLMNSDDSEHQARTMMPTGIYQYAAQTTQDTETARELEDIGLVSIKQTEDGFYFAYTPEGIALTKRLLRGGSL